MDSCLNCGGAIFEPGKPYGYVGKVCHCPAHPSRMYQNPASDPLHSFRRAPLSPLQDRSHETRFTFWTRA
jgi:hypothetical protein